MLNMLRIISWLCFCGTLASCGVFKQIDETLPDNRVDYRKSATLPPLEVPPDLTSSTLNEELAVPGISTKDKPTLSQYDKTTPQATVKTGNVLPLSERVEIKRDGNVRWLVLQGDPETVWSKVRSFWLDAGFLLTFEDPRIGIMETEWKENRADIPEDMVRKYLGKALDSVYSASTRDKFRIRLERGSLAGTTEVYLSHRGAEEVAKGDQFVWQNRPTNPDLEAEMLNRLLVFTGIDKERAKTLITNAETTKSRADLIRNTEGQVSLLVREDLTDAWRRTGLALDRVGFTVEDRDRAKGMYFVRYIDPDRSGKKEGFFSGWFSSSKPVADQQEFLINLKEEQQTTRITVLNKQEQLETSKTAEKILTLLQEQLK